MQWIYTLQKPEVFFANKMTGASRGLWCRSAEVAELKQTWSIPELVRGCCAWSRRLMRVYNPVHLNECFLCNLLCVIF